MWLLLWNYVNHLMCGDTHISLQLLTALLPLSVHPNITPFLTALLPLSTANNENGPRQTELHEGSHAQQLCQPANGRADWTAGDLYIRRPSNQRKGFSSSESSAIRRSKLPTTQQERTSARQPRDCTQRPNSRSRRIVNSAFSSDSK